jgi:hypothetical protein
MSRLGLARTSCAALFVTSGRIHIDEREVVSQQSDSCTRRVTVSSVAGSQAVMNRPIITSGRSIERFGIHFFNPDEFPKD